MRVRYAIGGIAAAALIALPAGAAAKQGGQVESLAALQCNQERADLGKRAFVRKYGSKHTMRGCIKRTRPRVNVAIGTAAGDCQDELAESGDAEFIDDYADNPTDSIDSAMDDGSDG